MSAEQNSHEKHSSEPDQQKTARPSRRKRNIFIFLAVLAIAGVGALLYWLHARNFQTTDDAQIDGNLSPIGARVDGTVIAVYVHNNQRVKIGDPLVDLDPHNLQAKLDQAKADLAQAQSALMGQRPNLSIAQVRTSTDIASAQASLASAEAAVAAAQGDQDEAAARVQAQEAANVRAQNDLNRYRALAGKQEISKSNFDQYVADAKQQAASLKAAQAALLAAEGVVRQRIAQANQSRTQLLQNEKTAGPQLSIRRASIEEERANVQSAQARLEQAQLNLDYAKIVAPVAGIVMRRSAQVGARVSRGQQLLTISQVGHLWVTANFKETQLLHMKPGQHATIHVDALDRDFSGSVQSIGGATGSAASILPPENATGNFVKVVQRIPVRISLDPGQEDLDRLRPGMSVEPSVRVR